MFFFLYMVMEVIVVYIVFNFLRVYFFIIGFFYGFFRVFISIFVIRYLIYQVWLEEFQELVWFEVWGVDDGFVLVFQELRKENFYYYKVCSLKVMGGC